MQAKAVITIPKGFPVESDISQFCAIVVYSDIKRTGRVETSNSMLNQFISNVFCGQKGNFLDVPTDCPQRDEWLGWNYGRWKFLE